MESLADEWDPATGIDSFGTDNEANKARGKNIIFKNSSVKVFAKQKE